MHLLRTFRFWRYIRAVERSGQNFNMDTHLQTGRRPGLVAIPCMACPEPDFNMPPDWRETARDLQFVFSYAC